MFEISPDFNYLNSYTNLLHNFLSSNKDNSENKDEQYKDRNIIIDYMDSSISTSLSTSVNFIGYFLINYQMNNSTSIENLKLPLCPVLIAQPKVGKPNLTSFMLSCMDNSKNTNNKYYSFYYILNNDIKNKIYISKKQRYNEVSSIINIENTSFKSQLAVDFFCEIVFSSGELKSSTNKVHLEPENTFIDFSKEIINNNFFNLDNLNIEDLDLNDNEIYVRSKTLGSLSIPKKNYLSTTKVNYKNNKYTIIDPLCSELRCENNSDCYVVTQHLVCYCYSDKSILNNDYSNFNYGLNCHIDNNNKEYIMPKLEYLFMKSTNIINPFYSLVNDNQLYNYSGINNANS